MSHNKLEERVAALEAQMADLKATLANGDERRDWRRTIGMFTGDEGMRELFKEAHKIRAADRKRTRRQQAKSRQAKR